MFRLMMDMPLPATDTLCVSVISRDDAQVISCNINGGIHRYSYSTSKKRCGLLTAGGKLRKTELRETLAERGYSRSPQSMPPDHAKQPCRWH